MPDPPQEPKRARGHALPRSGPEIDRISQVTDLDVVRARKLWKAKAPEPFKGLIDAKPEPESDDR
jgi:hypothetical protein